MVVMEFGRWETAKDIVRRQKAYAKRFKKLQQPKLDAAAEKVCAPLIETTKKLLDEAIADAKRELKDKPLFTLVIKDAKLRRNKKVVKFLRECERRISDELRAQRWYS